MSVGGLEKSFNLSKGGRLSLIKSTLSNLPTYFLLLFPYPSNQFSFSKLVDNLYANEIRWFGGSKSGSI
jgi:hypothetical protein